MLELSIRRHLENKKILLMTHIVLGYPSFEENRRVIKAMVDAGVELMELQIPFSEPIADGPVILKANSKALENNTKVKDCIAFANEICESFPDVSFLFMTYYNIIYVRGEDRIVKEAKDAGIKGFIIPDLPPEEAGEWLKRCENNDLNSIFIFTPTHSKERLKELAEVSRGLVYCVGRRGVTGVKTEFDNIIANQIQRYRSETNLPLAFGFGVQTKSDVEYLTGKVDIAVIGSKMIEIHNQKGAVEVGNFLRSLRL